MQSLHNATFHVKTWLPPAHLSDRSARAIGEDVQFIFSSLRERRKAKASICHKNKAASDAFFSQCANTRAIERTKKTPTNKNTNSGLASYRRKGKRGKEQKGRKGERIHINNAMLHPSASLGWSADRPWWRRLGMPPVRSLLVWIGGTDRPQFPPLLFFSGFLSFPSNGRPVSFPPTGLFLLRSSIGRHTHTTEYSRPNVRPRGGMRQCRNVHIRLFLWRETDGALGSVTWRCIQKRFLSDETTNGNWIKRTAQA